MIKGLISVITPVYNAERYLNKYFDSLYNQSYKNIEIIITDDGSTDNTKKIIDKYVDKFKDIHIKVIYKYQENRGQAAAINNALKDVNGEFLYWQDVDDFCETDALENMVLFLNYNHNYNIVRGKVRFWQDGKIIREVGPKKVSKEYIFEQYLFTKDSYCFAGIFMIRMSFFDINIPKRMIFESRAGQNWQLILPNIYRSKCGYIDKVVYNCNIIESSHSRIKRTNGQLIERNKELMNILLNTLKGIRSMNCIVKTYYSFIIYFKYNYKSLKIRLNKCAMYKFLKRIKECLKSDDSRKR